MTPTRSWLLALLAVAAVATAAPRPDEEVVPALVTTVLADVLLPPAEGAARIEAGLSAAPATERPWLLLHAGELRRVAGQSDAARRHFADLLQQQAGPQFDAAARLGLALLDADRAGLEPATLQSLISITERDVPDSQNAERFAWLAVRAVQNGAPPDAQLTRARGFAVGRPERIDRIDAIFARSRPATTAAPAATTAAPAATAATPASTPTAAPSTPSATTGVPRTPSADPLLAAREALADEHRDEARRLATQVRDTTTDDAVRARAQLVLDAADGARVDPSKVAVLLPLTGRFGTAGTQVREALQLGWTATGAAPRLVFVDTGGTASGAVAAVDKAVKQEGAVALIGPLLGDELLPVVERADAYGVPLVTLNQGLDDASATPFVFQGWLTIRQQVDALLDYTTGPLGITSYAVLEPDNSYGHAASEAFVASAATHGATITVRHVYDPDASDYRSVGLAVGRKARDSDVPIVDFGAIFLPDKARRVSLVAAGIAVAEVPVGGFTPQGSDKRVRLLGLSGWNAYDLLAGGGMYTTSALFTDVFVSPPDRAYHWYTRDGWSAFVDDFRAQTDRTPTPAEVLAADVGRVIGQALKAAPPSRLAVRDALIDVVVEGSLTGATRFDPLTRVLQRQVHVMSVRKDGFEPVSGTREEP